MRHPFTALEVLGGSIDSGLTSPESLQERLLPKFDKHEQPLHVLSASEGFPFLPSLYDAGGRKGECSGMSAFYLLLFSFAGFGDLFG